jgi:dolichol kinase
MYKFHIEEISVRRKLFHFSSVLIPLIYLFTSKLAMMIILIIVSGGAIFVDITRHYNPLLKSLVDNIFSSIMRYDELSGGMKLSGVTYIFLGFLATCLLFSKPVAIASYFVLIFADSAAAVVGERIGIPTHEKKSLEGTVAFIMTAILFAMLSYSLCPFKTSFLSVVLASILAGIVEYKTTDRDIDDNFTIPLVFGITITFLGWF